MCSDIAVTAQTESLYRVSKLKKNGNRIFFVGLNCEEERNKLLIHAEKLKDIVDYKDVYINKNLTKSQPEQ